MDLETAEAELKHQRQDLAWQRATHPLSNDKDARIGAPSGLYFPHVDTRTGASSGLLFPRATYNMVATTCRLENISDMPDLKTNERLHEAKQLLHITLEQ